MCDICSGSDCGRFPCGEAGTRLESRVSMILAQSVQRYVPVKAGSQDFQRQNRWQNYMCEMYVAKGK
jgi:hypothetical protein